GNERLQEARFLLLVAHRRDQLAPFPVLAERFRNRTVAFGELGHDERLRDEVDAVASERFRRRRRSEAELRAFPDDFPVEGIARRFDRVALQRKRAYLFLRKLAGLQLPFALLCVQRKVHFCLLRIEPTARLAARTPRRL